MNAELSSLLENKRCGEAAVAARKAVIAGMKGEAAEGHKATLAREEADLASILPRIAELSAPSATPKTKP